MASHFKAASMQLNCLGVEKWSTPRRISNSETGKACASGSAGPTKSRQSGGSVGPHQPKYLPSLYLAKFAVPKWQSHAAELSGDT